MELKKFPSENAVNVTVIVTTKNEERNIANCLESIKVQSYPSGKIEIIVVDNNSTDKTKEIAFQYTDKVYNFGPERAAQLNFGVRLAKGAYILFPDADMILSNNIIKECIEKCENKNLIALYIPEKIIGKGFWGKVRNFERNFYNMTCIDAVRFVKKDKFLKINGFDENLLFGPDDWDFDRRIKEAGNIHIIDAVVYHNEQEISLGKYLRKKANYFHTFDKYIQKWGKNDPIIKKQLGFWYRYFGVFIEDGKWKRLLRHPILTLGLYFLKVTVGIQYWHGRVV